MDRKTIAEYVRAAAAAGIERDRRAATVITSNRAVDEWVALFDDPILANSALDRRGGADAK